MSQDQGNKKQVNLYGIAASLEPEKQKAPVPLRGDFERICDIAAEIGYDGVELQMRDPHRMDAVGMKRIAEERGLKIIALATGKEAHINGLCLTHDDPKVRKATIARMKEYADLAAYWGAIPSIAFLKGNLSDPSQYDVCYNRLVESFKDICEYAEKKQAVFAVEAVNLYIINWMNSIKENTDLIRDVNSPSLTIHIDSHHIHIEEHNMEQAVEYCRDVLSYVHLSDGNRLFPGGGSFPFLNFLERVMATGYQGFYTMEIVPVPSQVESAQIALEYVKALEAQIRNIPDSYFYDHFSR
ncbi:MAG: sugar phosphate isomerase/epimerase family protein [Christensenellales bacterium]